jgi:hypothetical protein
MSMDGRVNGNRSTFAARRSAFAGRRSPFVVRRSIWLAGLTVALALSFVRTASPQSPPSSALPELTAPVNDFAKVIDADSAGAIDRMIPRSRRPVIVVVDRADHRTVRRHNGSRQAVREHGRASEEGEGQRAADLSRSKEHRQNEVVHFEAVVTDGFSGGTGRPIDVAFFRQGHTARAYALAPALHRPDRSGTRCHAQACCASQVSSSAATPCRLGPHRHFIVALIGASASDGQWLWTRRLVERRRSLRRRLAVVSAAGALAAGTVWVGAGLAVASAGSGAAAAAAVAAAPVGRMAI